MLEVLWRSRDSDKGKFRFCHESNFSFSMHVHLTSFVGAVIIIGWDKSPEPPRQDSLEHVPRVLADPILGWPAVHIVQTLNGVKPVAAQVYGHKSRLGLGLSIWVHSQKAAEVRLQPQGQSFRSVDLGCWAEDCGRATSPVARPQSHIGFQSINWHPLELYDCIGHGLSNRC